MKRWWLAFPLCLGCNCNEESSPRTQTTVPIQTSADPMTPILASPRWTIQAENTVLVDEQGHIRLENESYDTAGQLRNRIVLNEPPDGNAFSLEAAPTATWGQIRPVLAAMSEAPLPGFVITRSILYDTRIELASWSRHPGQVSVQDQANRREPLTFVLTVTDSGLRLNEHEVGSTEQLIALIEATVVQNPGGTIPVTIRADDNVSWGRILEIAVAADGALGEERVAMWNEAPTEP